ncbi:AAA family ATPase [Microbacterium sp. B2969]|uniref:Nuclease SbcCD subunit C n=1 Tax=Microbacterium alkaliflavum TaxID=3248839 RepID=A0ABW7Q3N8_9MICO
MKLHRLELEAFGPFLERQTVDFDAFDAHGLFLIAGRTGAGKSSILDGICYALYGTAPRYDGSDRGLRSDHAAPHEPTEARLEFTAGGTRWRIARTPEYERPKARGEGMTPAKASVLLEERVGGEWTGRATKAREVGDLLDEIVGLNRDQFQQVILLAQNRFAEFLLARNDDRQALLRTLFGSRRYEEYEQAFEKRRRASHEAMMTDAATLDALLIQAETILVEEDLVGAEADVEPPSAAGRLAAIERALPRATYRVDESVRRREEAEVAHDAALAAYGALSAQRKLQEERLAVRATYAALEQRETIVAADRVVLARARAAEAVRAPIEAARSARAAATAAGQAETVARSAWIAAGEENAEAPALRSLVDMLGGELAVAAHAAEAERTLPALLAARDEMDRLVAASEAALATLAAAHAERETRLAALEPQLAHARAAAPALIPAREAVAAARARLAAGREAADHARRVVEAERTHADALAAAGEATAVVRRLLQRRLDGYAGELAATLVDGEPCVVCGASEHPSPAAPNDEPVTDDAVATAEASAASAAAVAEAASARARDARAAHHEASARAGGVAVDELEAAVAAAESTLNAAIDAEAVVVGLEAAIADVRSAGVTAAAEREALTAGLTGVIEERAAAQQHEASAREAVAHARGEHASVAMRIDWMTRRRDLARALAEAAEESARRGAAAVDAEASRDEQIAAGVFAGVEDATLALLDEPRQVRLAAEIRAHEIALSTQRERLRVLETDLAGVPDEPIDLAPAAAAADAARDTRNTAVRSAARHAEVAGQLERAASRAALAHADSAGRAAEHDLIAGLANAVAGRTDSRMDLETFVLAAELEEIAAAANLRLDAMSSGRYRLRHTDVVGARRVASGLGLEILDAYTGQARTPQSLSGGETFLASLALALGLAEVVTARAGGVRLDTLFIDEGFGSLDADTLELAMRTLDELRQGGRTVGVISHVEAMKEQLPAQLLVEATPRGPSVVRAAALVG